MERKPQQIRIFSLERDGPAKGDAIPVVVSTDAIVNVADGPEILVHTREAVDLQRAPLPIIATHQHGQINVGIVDDMHISGGKLRGVARFGSRPEAAEYKADVLNGIIRALSVGYERIKAKVRGDGVLVTERWMPTHAAMVAQPADVGAGFFRGHEPGPTRPVALPQLRRKTVLVLRNVVIPRATFMSVDPAMAAALVDLRFAVDAGED